MDNEIRNNAPERPAVANDPSHDPATPRDRAVGGLGDGPWLTPEELRNKLAATDPEKEPDRYEYLRGLVAAVRNPKNKTAPTARPTEPTATAAGFRIRHCKWCGQVDTRGARRETDVVAILIVGKVTMACWNGKPMIVQDGICEPCGEKLKAGRVIDRSTTL